MPAASPSKMDIPFYALDLQQDFRRIVDYFVDDYLERSNAQSLCEVQSLDQIWAII